VLTTFAVPPDSVRILADELALAIGDGSLARHLGQPITPDQLSATSPHPLFYLGVDELLDEFDPFLAEHTGWRYLIEVGQQVMAAAETRSESGLHHFAHVSVGPLVAATQRAIRLADETLDDNAAYAFAGLEIPGIKTTLLWLSSTIDPADELFLPIGLIPRGLRPDHLYRRAEVGAVLIPLAAETRERYRRGEAGLGG